MEIIQNPDCRKYVSSLIKIRDFLQDWMDVLEGGPSGTQQPNVSIQPTQVLNKISESMDLDGSRTKNLAQICSPDALYCPGEMILNREETDLIYPANVDLITVGCQKKELERRAKSTFKTVKRACRHKHCHEELYNNLSNVGRLKRINERLDIVLSVQVFRPIVDRKVTRTNSKLLLDEEFLVLGQQKLTELRDKIKCVSDYSIPGNFASNPRRKLSTKNNKTLFKSGFFYIEGAFYSDMRCPTNIDYSKIIIDWSSDKSAKMGPFTTAKMETTRFIDLSIRLGLPYVYVHQGQCEHLIVFSDMRINSPKDNPSLNAYPLTRCLSVKPRSCCMVCHYRTAEWVTIQHENLPETPFFFCNTCFNSFNYTDGKKVGEFEAYAFTDKTALP